MESAVVLTVLALAFALLVHGRLSPDVVAMGVLTVLVLTGCIAAGEVFSGFSSYAVITIAALMIVGDGLKRTGVVHWVARRLETVIRRSESRLLLLNTSIPGVLSGFVNIVASATFFIPVVLRLCKQMRVPQSRILMPMAFAALVGANLSLIGASHNLVVHSLLERAEGSGFRFFELGPMGLTLLVVAILYAFVFGRRLLPGARAAPPPEEVPRTANLVEAYGLEDRCFEVWAEETFEERPRTLRDLAPEEGRGLAVLAVVRDGDRLRFPAPDLVVEPRDMLLLHGREEAVEGFAADVGDLTFLGPPRAQEAYPVSTGELAEAVWR